jgi:hypothetical protein
MFGSRTITLKLKAKSEIEILRNSWFSILKSETYILNTNHRKYSDSRSMIDCQNIWIILMTIDVKCSTHRLRSVPSPLLIFRNHNIGPWNWNHWIQYSLIETFSNMKKKNIKLSCMRKVGHPWWASSTPWHSAVLLCSNKPLWELKLLVNSISNEFQGLRIVAFELGEFFHTVPRPLVLLYYFRANLCAFSCCLREFFYLYYFHNFQLGKLLEFFDR